MKIKILLFGEPDSCNQLRQYLRDSELEVVGNIYSDNLVLDEINRSSPDFIIVTDTSPMTLRACNQVYLLRPRCVPLLLTDTEDITLLMKLTHLGIHYILPTKISAAQLISEIKGIYSSESNRIVSLENTGVGSSKSKVVVVFGAKDGIGKTTLAVNLGIKLAQNKNKVVILDYNMQFGDVGSYLGAKSKGTIVELLQEQSNPNVDMIRQFLTLHVSGVQFLAAPFSPEDANMVSSAQAERIISTLRVYYDYVIVDVNGAFDDISIACMDIASQILFVTGNDVPSLINAQKSLSIIKALTDEQKIKLIIGKMGEGSIGISDISKALGMIVTNAIPEEKKALINAANQGNPIVLSSPRCKASAKIAEIADSLDKGDAQKRGLFGARSAGEKKRGLFGRSL